ncbi:sigma-70 family RNA polymerase sigma factor [Dysgonomonas sp. 520]|nr:sigma-70 family RNA polymerase sigma factor [Dysgonomonas sp. 520]NDW08611.1 sigma-70 family RNA polymerase sigma factor [Dysgonomonas sp. 520]
MRTVINVKEDFPMENNVSDIFMKYQSQLKGFINKRVPSKEDAEDILQNVFYQLMKVDLKENPINQMSAWLYSVTRNQIIDFSRKHKEEEMPYLRDNNGDVSFIKELTDMILDEDSSPEMEYLKSLIWVELDSALGELPVEQREIFELTELQGFSFKEISESTGITVNTLISRKRYAVLHLRERLYDLYNELLKD